MEEQIVGIYMNNVYVEPRELADGFWAWVVCGVDYKQEITTPDGGQISVDIFPVKGTSREELFSQLNW